MTAFSQLAAVAGNAAAAVDVGNSAGTPDGARYPINLASHYPVNTQMIVHFCPFGLYDIAANADVAAAST